MQATMNPKNHRGVLMGMAVAMLDLSIGPEVGWTASHGNLRFHINTPFCRLRTLLSSSTDLPAVTQEGWVLVPGVTPAIPMSGGSTVMYLSVVSHTGPGLFTYVVMYELL